MNVYRDFEEIEYDENTVLTVGTFDGVHKGHQKIINRLKQIADEENSRAVIITMDPHPQIVLQKESKPPISLLTNINERIKAFRKFGLKHCVVISFSYEFSRTPAEKFIRDYLHGKIGMKKILIGYDHMFGKNREGDEDLLDRLGKELNFEVERIGPLEAGDTVISSTKIRHALQDSDIEKANEMLGHDYLLQGTVVKGESRGKKLGFPTANIVPPDRHKLLPGNGVYVVSSEIEGKKYFGMANIGYRPTFEGGGMPLLEVNFFDLDMDLYGKDLYVYFHKYIRKEKKFNGSDELVDQIKEDEKIAKNFIDKNFEK